ncbi:MAG TPA: aminoacyl-tRNA hydrolase [Desulfobacteraceae bacterium]|nr:aminoacyl-tRNA hydrolase [Desulfobacteraceae bacterium]
MLDISNKVRIPESNVTIQAIRAQGPGGQNVNKVASAVHLRFDIRASDLPEFYKERLLAMSDHRITRDGVIIIKAQTFRSREKNLEDGMDRLTALIRSAGRPKKKRKATRPSRAARKRRMDSKTKHSRTKALRKKIKY